MALETTVQAVAAVLKSDPTVTPKSRSEFLATLRNGARNTKPETASDRVPRIIRRREAAARLSCSLRTIDKLNVQGILQKRKLPGRVRSSGFLESDMVALITQKGAA